MKKCVYYNCSEYTSDTFEEGFEFCPDHLACLNDLIDYDAESEDSKAILAFCLTVLSGRSARDIFTLH